MQGSKWAPAIAKSDLTKVINSEVRIVFRTFIFPFYIFSRLLSVERLIMITQSPRDEYPPPIIIVQAVRIITSALYV